MTQPTLNFDALLPELAIRIADARRSPMSDAARDVLSLLVDHPAGARAGRDKALSIAAMQGAWDYAGQHIWSERVVKAAVKELLEDCGVPIGSSRRSGNSGYYLISSCADLEAAERPLKGEVLSLLKRLRTINPRTDFCRHLAGQFEIGGDSAAITQLQEEPCR